MPAPPSVQSTDEQSATSELASIVEESRLLANLTRTYGWSGADRAAFVQGITAPLQGAADWRLQNLLAVDRKYSLNLLTTRGSTVLDAGSGAGSLVIAARRAGVEMVGVELDDASLELARGLIGASGIGGHRSPSVFVRGDLQRLPFRCKSFAMITCHQVLEHTETPDAVLQETLRCLKPGGLIWLDAPDYRFCCEPHYRIPWLPNMAQDTARHWLEAFNRPPTGLGTFRYTCLPLCLQMLKALHVEILHAGTTTSLEQIDEQFQILLGLTGQGCLPVQPEAVLDLARRAQSAGFSPEPTSFLILGRKPSERTRT